MILILSRNNTSNETNAGNSKGKLCFFWHLCWQICLIFFSIRVQYVFEHRGQGTLILYLIKLLLFLMGHRWAGLQKQWLKSREHTSSLVLFLFSWQNLESLCQNNQVCIWISKTHHWRLLWDSIFQVSLADADFCDQSACAHHRRTLEKENKCGNNNLLCNAWFIVLFLVTVVVK